MNKKAFFRQLKVQLTSYYFIVSIVIVFIMSSVFYYSASKIILDDTLEQTIYSVEQTSSDLEDYVKELKGTALYLSKNDKVIDYLKGGSKSSAYDVIDQALETKSALVSIVVVGKEGAVLSNEKDLTMSVSDDMMKEAWYVNALDNQNMPALTSARLQEFTMDKNTWVIALSQEIIDQEGNNLGVVLLDLEYKVIEGYLDHLPLGEEGFAFIMDDMSKVVYHPDTSYFLNDEKTEELIGMVSGKEGYDQTSRLLTHHVEIPNTQWTLVGVASLDRLDVLRRQLFEVLFLIGLIVMGFVIGGSLLIANRVTYPIKRLQLSMNKLERMKVIKKSSLEVEHLTDSYHNMLDEIQTLMHEIKENESYLRQYELNALHSQINPHFLYNTLDTIVWMAEFNDSEKVIEVTKALAQFFRISLSKGQELISLESEIDHIRQYLFIQKMRYDDQLNYDIELPENLKEFKVPKIILQPLVENALYHGIKESSRSGHIHIVCKEDDKTVFLSVRDNGVGFDDEDKKHHLKLGGVGLSNVKKRVLLVYPEADFRVNSRVGEGTLIEISIPKELH